ncbi:MAG TPA: hypothetical protein VNS81_03450 [Nocardioides sp.]|nr:hypothetical protein [Nocardioides sp.]
MNQPKITDAGVAGLALTEGRAELLEEIMATTPLETARPPRPGRYDDRPPRHRRWIATVGAAAAVAALVGGVAWLADRQDQPAREPAVAASPADSELAALSADGWQVEHTSAGPDGTILGANGGEVDYRKGAQLLEVTWHRAGLHDDYVEDRDDVGPRTPVSLLGRPSIMWAYSAKDHAVIRPATGRYFLEVRGGGMSRAAFLDVLEQLRPVDEPGLAASVAATAPVPKKDRLYQAPPKPVLVTAPGWTLEVSEEGAVSWAGPDGARLSEAWVSGVEDTFTYDRYRDLSDRATIRLLGVRTLLVAWAEGGKDYRAAATSPLVGDTILVLEASGMSRDAFLDAVRSVRVVPAGEYERTVKAAIH